MKALYANLAAGVAVVLKNRVTAPLIAPEKQNVLQQQILQSFPASAGPSSNQRYAGGAGWGRSEHWNVHTPKPPRAPARKPHLSPCSLRAEAPSPTKSTQAERDGAAASFGSEHQKNLRAAQ